MVAVIDYIMSIMTTNFKRYQKSSGIDKGRSKIKNNQKTVNLNLFKNDVKSEIYLKKYRFNRHVFTIIDVKLVKSI